MTNKIASKLDQTIESTLGVISDHDIMEAIGLISSEAEERWGDMCSDLPVVLKYDDEVCSTTLKAANNLLDEWESKYEAICVEPSDDDEDEYSWTFQLKA